VPAAPAAPAAPPPRAPLVRYHYRHPATGAVVEPYSLRHFAKWVADGVISAHAAAALRMWREGESEEAHARALSELLAEAAAAAAGGWGA
jgi:hypothetical protein